MARASCSACACAHVADGSRGPPSSQLGLDRALATVVRLVRRVFFSLRERSTAVGNVRRGCASAAAPAHDAPSDDELGGVDGAREQPFGTRRPGPFALAPAPDDTLDSLVTDAIRIAARRVRSCCAAAVTATLSLGYVRAATLAVAGGRGVLFGPTHGSGRACRSARLFPLQTGFVLSRVL